MTLIVLGIILLKILVGGQLFHINSYVKKISKNSERLRWMYRLFGKDYRVETFSVYDRPKAKKELSVTDPNNRKDLLLKNIT